MDPLHHHHHHHHAPLHWGYTGTAVAHPHPQAQHHNSWMPAGNNNGNSVNTTSSSGGTSAVTASVMSSRKLKRAMSDSDCEDLYSEESSKEQTSPGESDSCHMMSRKKRRGVIEKKRRDRINYSLCELKRLVPSAYEKQGSAKLEKAEILQLTVDHLKNISKGGSDGVPFDAQRFAVDYHIVGFRECASEVARYLVTMEGMDIQDPLRLRLMSHLQCFVAQRELQLKSQANGSAADLLSPAAMPSNTASATSGIVNPVSPNMGQHQSSNWYPSSQENTNSTSYQMTYQQNGYNASQSSGYVPNLPPPLSHYEQYGLQRSSATENPSSYASDTNTATASTRSGVTTRSQSNSRATNRATPANDVNNSAADQSGPTYTDLSASSAQTADATASVATSSSAATLSTASVSGSGQRLQNNYNIYGHIHYPADAAAFGGQYGYNFHLDPSRGGYGSAQGAGSPGSGRGGEVKPYRPWGAEMAY